MLVAQKTYSAYIWICSETLPRDCDYKALSKKIMCRVKIFKIFLDATRLRQFPTDQDKIREAAILKNVADDMYSMYVEKTDVLIRQ
ncbi:MAG: hypothetical protein COW60_02280 [Candidatus Yonathbacteria bacterium CG17_big_fil_post_rev_8_21_14_2_50_43_9]|nr:MAG: hypothetical protein COW60_02280 [Candidatus Yonathbacteria bacterium CG17_big_fil_post_rev_8_21_14_2_50_43_9]